MSRVNNRGAHFRRIQFNTKERVLADRWEKENQSVRGYCRDNGILQDLFMKGTDSALHHPYATHVLTDRERMITATAIQWLGTSVGFDWLEGVLRECGYKLVKESKQLE